MGEIGIPRREFLYELTYWEAARIVKGYRRRGRLTHQLLAEVVFAAIYSTREPKGTTVADMFPALFEDENREIEPPMSEEDQKELQELMKHVSF